MSKFHVLNDQWKRLFVRIYEPIKTFLDSRSGVGAVEFAFMAPFFLAIYISSFELTVGFVTAQKTIKAAGTVADIVARQSSVNKAFLDGMIEATEATLAPHSTTGLKLKISGVSIDGSGNGTILWSWNELDQRPYETGAAVSVPEDLRQPSSFLIHAEIELPHTLLLFLSSTTGNSAQNQTITITRDFFYRQRLGDYITCTDC